MKAKFKTTKHVTLIILISLIAIPSFCQQPSLIGLWEGMFMDQFRMEILILSNEDKNISGTIKMYDGSIMIQEDELSNIEYDNRMISFMIPAKETTFEGEINDDLSQFSGYFIFPDGNRHPVHVLRKATENKKRDASPGITSNILTEEFSPAQMKEDLVFLRSHLSEMHPQYHLYTGEEAYDALYRSIIQKLGSDLTLAEYFKLISPVVNKIGCSHTGIRLPEEYTQAQRKYNHYLPVNVFVKNERTWVVGSVDDRDYIVPGSEIISINNMPVEGIISRLLSLMPSEGYNKSTKYYEINRDFGTYFNLLNNSEQFHIEYKEPAYSEISSTRVNAVSYMSYSSEKGSDFMGFPIFYPVNKELNTAVIEIRSFAIPDVNEYISLLDSTFRAIRKEKINNLVIDLRGNQGGHPIFAAILYSFLTSEDFTYFKHNEDAPEFKPLYESMKPAEHNFKGNCYVLVDGGCLSTTGHLISLLKYHDRAIFIGEEPGSWFYCNDNSKQIYLPHTRIEVNIPRTTFKTDVKGYQMGDPFNVDYTLNKSLDDRIHGQDSWMEFTLNLISRSDTSSDKIMNHP